MSDAIFVVKAGSSPSQVVRAMAHMAVNMPPIGDVSRVVVLYARTMDEWASVASSSRLQGLEGSGIILAHRVGHDEVTARLPLWRAGGGPI